MPIFPTITVNAPLSQETLKTIPKGYSVECSVGKYCTEIEIGQGDLYPPENDDIDVYCEWAEEIANTLEVGVSVYLENTDDENETIHYGPYKEWNTLVDKRNDATDAINEFITALLAYNPKASIKSYRKIQRQMYNIKK